MKQFQRCKGDTRFHSSSNSMREIISKMIFTIIFTRITFLTYGRLKLAKTLANAKLHPEAEHFTNMSKKTSLSVSMRLYD